MNYENSSAFALAADQADILNHCRAQFHFPQHNGQNALYFCGNSLGLQPKGVQQILQQELEDWKNYGVEGHFQAKNPWFSYHTILTEPLAEIVGAKPVEVVAANTLTANLHLAMVSFYRPVKNGRYKIIMEAAAFPSDQYAIESQVRWHGFDPEDAIIEIKPRAGEYTLHTQDIIQAIQDNADSVALVMFSGVQYLTGQRFDMQAIAQAAQKAGAYMGLDLAHAVGNVELELHNWNIDFAVWCSYKYLNSGPGGIGGLFIHENHAASSELPRFAGWWGYDQSTRFLMQKGFKPAYGAEGWQLSNAQVFQMAALKASVDVFQSVALSDVFAKRDNLSGYAWFLLRQIKTEFPDLPLELITPENPADHGAQISMLLHQNGKELCNRLLQDGIIVDWREPNIIRMAPAPLYNSFTDVWQFAQRFRQHCKQLFML